MYFNPRSRVGNDANGYGKTTSEMTISIHVPAWGTTIIRAKSRSQSRDFNPRSRVGNDKYCQKQMAFSQYFNPRSRVGNDQINSNHICFYRYFNPRSRVGNDRSMAAILITCRFQSTFPRGERRYILPYYL